MHIIWSNFTNTEPTTNPILNPNYRPSRHCYGQPNLRLQNAGFPELGLELGPPSMVDGEFGTTVRSLAGIFTVQVSFLYNIIGVCQIVYVC